MAIISEQILAGDIKPFYMRIICLFNIQSFVEPQTIHQVSITNAIDQRITFNIISDEPQYIAMKPANVTLMGDAEYAFQYFNPAEW